MSDRNNLRLIVRGSYDIQKLRIQMGNRIVRNFKAKLGQEASESEDALTPEAKDLLKNLRISYKKLMDGLTSFPTPAKFKGNEVISNYTELCLLNQYIELEKSEASHFRKLGNILEEFPIYTEYLKGVKGVGPAMAGVIISEIDIHKSKYSSSIWKYAGLDVAEDGKGRSMKSEHLVDVEYEAKDGSIKTKKSITFNPFLKSKLMGVLSGSFMKLNNKKYRKIYDDYKHRLENHAIYKDDTPGHRNNMAKRYMIKMFIIELYEQWREIEGLECFRPYHEAKLGLHHHQSKEELQKQIDDLKKKLGA